MAKKGRMPYKDDDEEEYEEVPPAIQEEAPVEEIEDDAAEVGPYQCYYFAVTVNKLGYHVFKAKTQRLLLKELDGTPLADILEIIRGRKVELIPKITYSFEKTKRKK